jgi:hypothetical protein
MTNYLSRLKARSGQKSLPGEPPKPPKPLRACSQVGFGGFGGAEGGHFLRAELPEAVHSSAGLTDAHEERTANVEFDSRVPRSWAEGFARLDRARPPDDVPQRRWLRFVDDCGAFLESSWPATAQALGWGPLDLFGCNRHRPWARIDQAGLLWLMAGRRLVALTADSATIETASGGRLTYRRAPNDPGRVLAWSLYGGGDR